MPKGPTGNGSPASRAPAITKCARLAILWIDKFDGTVKKNRATLLRYLCAPKQKGARSGGVHKKDSPSNASKRRQGPFLAHYWRHPARTAVHSYTSLSINSTK